MLQEVSDNVARLVVFFVATIANDNDVVVYDDAGICVLKIIHVKLQISKW